MAGIRVKPCTRRAAASSGPADGARRRAVIVHSARIPPPPPPGPARSGGLVTGGGGSAMLGSGPIAAGDVARGQGGGGVGSLRRALLVWVQSAAAPLPTVVSADCQRGAESLAALSEAAWQQLSSSRRAEPPQRRRAKLEGRGPWGGAREGGPGGGNKGREGRRERDRAEGRAALVRLPVLRYPGEGEGVSYRQRRCWRGGDGPSRAMRRAPGGSRAGAIRRSVASR